MSLMTQAWILDKYGPRLSVEQLAEILCISRSTINNQICQNVFPVATYREVGKRWADYRDVDAYLDRCREAVASV